MTFWSSTQPRMLIDKVCMQAYTLTQGPAMTSLSVSADGNHLLAHLVSHTLQLWPLSTVLQRLAEAPAVDSLPAGVSPVRPLHRILPQITAKPISMSVCTSSAISQLTNRAARMNGDEWACSPVSACCSALHLMFPQPDRQLPR